MILYKYVSFKAGLKILETGALGFFHLENFNEPFEATALGLTESDISQTVRFRACRAYQENMSFFHLLVHH